MTTPMVVGLTGGIGVGKSTVADLLAARGAEVIDVDGLGRDVLEPHGRAYPAVIETFGPGIVGDDGSIDRAALAGVVFGGGRLDELEAISHPAINALLQERIGAVSDGIVVLDMAVLAESTLGIFEHGPIYRRVVVVETPLEVRLERLLGRGLTIDDAERRIAAQATDADRRRLADLVITNGGTLDDLERRVGDLWPTFEAWASQ